MFLHANKSNTDTMFNALFLHRMQILQCDIFRKEAPLDPDVVYSAVKTILQQVKVSEINKARRLKAKYKTM